MSTRSGKRIHCSISENVETVSEIQIERKTRSKRDKQNTDIVATAKKKKNFVKHPSGDDVVNSNDITENISKSVRKSRRHTLKELNKPVNHEALSDRKSMQQPHRTRKENTVELSNVIQENNKPGKEKKKNKKKKRTAIENSENEPVEAVIITKTRNSRKKRKSNSFVVEELVTGENNKSNISIDSFHSAAGSPAKDNLKNDSLKGDKIGKNRDRKESKFCTSYNSVEKVKNTKKKNKKTEDDNYLVSSIDESVKLSATNESFETRRNKTENNEGKYEKKDSKKKSTEINSFNNIENTNSIDFNNFEENIHTTDLKRKSIEKTNKIKKSTSNFDFTNVNGIINGSDESISLSNNSFNKKSKSISKNSNSDNKDTYITLINECTEKKTDNFISETEMQSDEITFNHTTSSQKPRKSENKNATYEKINLSDTNLNQTFDKTINSFNQNSHPDNSTNSRCSRREASIKNTTYDKIEESLLNVDTTFDKETSKSFDAKVNSTAKKSRRSSRTSLTQVEVFTELNGTYDKIGKDVGTSFCNNTYEKLTLDTTIEKTIDSVGGDNTINLNSKSSIISSDNTENMTSDVSEDYSRISITSDNSGTENIVNTTPLLIESSIDESQNSMSMSVEKTTTPQKEKPIAKITPDKQGNVSEYNKTPHREEEIFTDSKTTPLKREGTYTELRKTPSKHRVTLTEEPEPQACENPTTPLKREGTFTKESPVVTSLKPKSVEKTPTRRQSMSSPGRTPYITSRSGSKVMLNVTHSIEKPPRRSSVAAALPRLTKVMFCSPVDNPVAVSQMKGKVIKSNLKGSNKSFMFDESVAEQSGESRKRSRTQGGAQSGAQGGTQGGAKRPRTTSAAARLQIPVEPMPPAAKSDSNTRTKLPDFAALHQKHFSKMESLDECQRRRARRARELLTPTRGPLAHHKETSDTAQSLITKKPESPKSKEIDKKNKNYTRFGFKLNLDVNPFSVPAKNTDINTKSIIKPKVLKRPALPSLAGTTLRKEAAKQTVMREKSFADRRDVNRNQNRTVIKGVRTNRRFELQMKMRNID